jgi:hypothetical protein
MSIKIKSFSKEKLYHTKYLNTLRMIENGNLLMGELFKRISDSEFGLTLIECAKSEDRIKMNETKIRLDMMRLDGHIMLIEGRYYITMHIELEEQ